MGRREDLQTMGEEILNAVTVIRGFFQLVNSDPEYDKIVEDEVRNIVCTINRNIFCPRIKIVGE
ncbi:MAG: hypothetical protein K6T65_09635 [Peptococcaceae bacterium]|nr:hypothetical protein [Peptococcaceae bacterium]